MFPQIFGKYVLERELASGGMARVYLATLRGAVGFEKRLVVKQIRPELALDEAFVRRFVEEAKIAVELSHPNIVPVYELGVELGIYYIAMELCEGLTLTEVLMDTGPLDAAEGAYVGSEICRALDYAHRRGGIVHRDVTPRNVLLDEEGAVRLIDFGIAAPVAPGQTRVEVFGSPGHMPPEQIRGEQLTPATDVFAVGALLIEAWTGRPPFRRGSFEASAAALKEPLPPLATLQPDIAPIVPLIEQTVALAPADRPQDAESLARKLREFSKPFDSGDVAKKLGGRVRRARRHAQSSESWLPEGTGTPLTPAASPRALLSSSRPPPRTPATPPMAPLTPATPPGTPPITRTFAARDDLVEWTRKLSSTPPPSAAVDERPSGANAVLRHSSPPPAVLEADEPATRAMQRSKPPEGALSPAKARPWALIGLSAVAVGALALVGLRGGSPVAAPPLAATNSAVAPPSALVSATPAALVASAPSLPMPLPSVSTEVKPHASATKPSTSSSTPAPSADAASAQLRLTADPQASVTVVGGRVAQTRSTPVASLSLPAGSYTVTFRSPTFGDPVATRVDLAAGAFRSVHADFRAAVPTVVVR